MGKITFNTELFWRAFPNKLSLSYLKKGGPQSVFQLHGITLLLFPDFGEEGLMDS